MDLYDFAPVAYASLTREGRITRPCGGDEFTVVLGALTRGRDAGLIAHKLVRAFEEPFEVTDCSM